MECFMGKKQRGSASKRVKDLEHESRQTEKDWWVNECAKCEMECISTRRKRNVNQALDFVAICLRASFYKLILIAHSICPYFHAYITISDMISFTKTSPPRRCDDFTLFMDVSVWWCVCVRFCARFIVSLSFHCRCCSLSLTNCFLFSVFAVCVI